MGQESQKATTSEVVRIWKEAKEHLGELCEATTKKEHRPVSEAEIVSKSVTAYYNKSKRKLGIV
jgi:hypothetical protein